jgi:hypothetical protein
MDTLSLLLQCVAHDYALHELKHASVLARRLARATEAQSELREFQSVLMAEIRARKDADQPADTEAP